MARKFWPPEVVESLFAVWGRYSVKDVCFYIESRHGLSFTPMAVRLKAHREGLDYRDAQGDLTLADAARELGVSCPTVRAALGRAGIKAYGTGRARFIREADFSRLLAMFPQAPWPSASVDEAAKRLRVEPRTVLRLIERGDLAACRFGRRWLVKAADIEQLAWARARRVA